MKFYGIDVQGYIKLRDFTDTTPVYSSSDEQKLIYVNNTIKLTDDIYIGGIQKGDWVRIITENDLITSFKNKIINGNFNINQREVNGTVVLSYNEYGHDRWIAGDDGCTYTFTTSDNITTLTIISGSLIQIIEGINLQSGTHVLSWTGTAQGRINAGSYGVSGSVTDDLTGGINTEIEFGTGTLSLVQFEKGTTNTDFEYKLIDDEKMLCRRYYQTGEVYYYGIGAYVNKFGASADLTPHMRIIPKVIWANIDNHVDFTSIPATDEIISNKKVIELRHTLMTDVFYERYFYTAFNADAELYKIFILDVAVIAGGSHHTVVLKENGDVHAWGRNNHGQCNHTDQVSPAYDEDTVRISGVKAIACGGQHTMVLKENGDVHTWGHNEYSQCNHTDQVSPALDETTVRISGVKTIACGDSHTVVLKENGDLHSWGSNGQGQCNYTNTPPLVLDETTVRMTDVKAIACGYAHTVVLKENGDVHSWGQNDHGQCNHTNTTTPVYDETTVRISGVKAIACGLYHTVVLKENGDVHSWGRNHNGQCNHTNTTTPALDETTVRISGVKTIACGDSHTVVLKENGDVHAWGNNSYAQCNHTDTTNPAYDETTVRMSGVKTIVVGYYHTVVLKENGDVHSWGNNEYGQCNHTNTISPAYNENTVRINLR